jgi:hypothetical protein
MLSARRNPSNVFSEELYLLIFCAIEHVKCTHGTLKFFKNPKCIVDVYQNVLLKSKFVPGLCAYRFEGLKINWLPSKPQRPSFITRRNKAKLHFDPLSHSNLNRQQTPGNVPIILQHHARIKIHTK